MLQMTSLFFFLGGGGGWTGKVSFCAAGYYELQSTIVVSGVVNGARCFCCVFQALGAVIFCWKCLVYFIKDERFFSTQNCLKDDEKNLYSDYGVSTTMHKSAVPVFPPGKTKSIFVKKNQFLEKTPNVQLTCATYRGQNSGCMHTMNLHKKKRECMCSHHEDMFVFRGAQVRTETLCLHRS